MRARALSSGWPPGRPLSRIVDKMLRNLWLVGWGVEGMGMVVPVC